jgi:hypothetical protein
MWKIGLPNCHGENDRRSGRRTSRGRQPNGGRTIDPPPTFSAENEGGGWRARLNASPHGLPFPDFGLPPAFPRFFWLLGRLSFFFGARMPLGSQGRPLVRFARRRRRSSSAFCRTSSSFRPRNPATAATDMPCLIASFKKSTSETNHALPTFAVELLWDMASPR